MPQIVPYLLTALIIGLCVLALRPRPAFVILIKNRKPHAKRGDVPAGFLDDCESILALFDVPDGSIKAYGRGRRASLVFSKSIPRALQQSFRNAWEAGR